MNENSVGILYARIVLDIEGGNVGLSSLKRYLSERALSSFIARDRHCELGVFHLNLIVNAILN